MLKGALRKISRFLIVLAMNANGNDLLTKVSNDKFDILSDYVDDFFGQMHDRRHFVRRCLAFVVILFMAAMICKEVRMFARWWPRFKRSFYVDTARGSEEQLFCVMWSHRLEVGPRSAECFDSVDSF